MATGQLGQGPWAAQLGRPAGGDDGGGGAGGVTSILPADDTIIIAPLDGTGDVTIAVDPAEVGAGLAGAGLTFNAGTEKLDNNLSTGVATTQTLTGTNTAGGTLIVRASSDVSRGLITFQGSPAGANAVALFTSPNNSVGVYMVDIFANGGGGHGTLRLRGIGGGGGLRVDSAAGMSVWNDATTQLFFAGGDNVTSALWMSEQTGFARWHTTTGATDGLTFNRALNRLGIGVAAPANQIDTSATASTWLATGTDAAAFSNIQFSQASGATLQLRAYGGSAAGSTFASIANAGQLVYNQSAAGLTGVHWFSTQSVPYRWSPGGVELMRLTPGVGLYTFQLGLGTQVAPAAQIDGTGLASPTWQSLSSSTTGSATLKMSGTANALTLRAYSATAAGTPFAGLAAADACFLDAGNAALFALGTTSGGPLVFYSNGVEAARFTAQSNVTGNFLLGTTTDGSQSAAILRVLASKALTSSVSAVWNGVDIMAATLTVTGATDISSGRLCLVNIAQPTITWDDPEAEIAASATVYIQNSPVSTNTLAGRLYSLWIDGGVPRIDSSVASAAGLVALGLVGPTGVSGAPTRWLVLDAEGVEYAIPMWPR